MHDELTAVDIKKMQEELEYRRIELRPKLIEDVKTAREFGDLSENFEYKSAKREKSRNDSRIRYLERMIKTAKVIDVRSNTDEIGLFDKVTIYIEEDDEEQTIELVTTLRQNALKGLISKESPVGKAVLGHKAGDRVLVEERIYGREVTDAVLGERYLPAVESFPAVGNFDYMAKYQVGGAKEVCPAELTEAEAKAVGEMAMRVHKALGLSVYSRTDMILDKNGQIWCLEANSLPGMTPNSFVPKEAAAVGISYDDLCEEIVEQSLKIKRR